MKTAFLAALLLVPFVVSAESRTYVPKVTPNETVVLDDGELAVSVLNTGEPVQFRFGDGVNPNGRLMIDTRTVLKTSAVLTLDDSDFVITFTGSALWTNGVIAGFPAVSLYTNTACSTITVSLVSADYRIQSVVPHVNESWARDTIPRVSVDGLSASWTVVHEEPPPGYFPDFWYYIEGLTVLVYADPGSIGATQDMRGFKVLVDHPARVFNGNIGGGAFTNTSDYLPVTIGWYSNNVQDAVEHWAEHVATANVGVRHGMTMDDGISLNQRFRWVYGPNGYLTLQHEADSNSPVFAIEAMDPYPWIVATATNNVSVLTWTTNGISGGTWYVQTCTNLGAIVWRNAVHLSTNVTTAGYMSVTASNTTPSDAVFWRVTCSNAVQAAAQVRFSTPVQAPRFNLSDTVYLYWSNGLRIVSGASNGVVGVTWQ